MRLNCLISWPVFLCFALILALLPISALAQEDTSNSNTEAVSITARQNPWDGWRIAGDFLIGTGRCDGKMCLGHPEDDRSHKGYTLAGLIQFEAGYFWGERIAFGPVIDVSIGEPMLMNVDIRYKTIVPFTEKDAISFSLGVGIEILTMYGLEFDVESNIYFPIQVGYEHVMDSGLIIGATIQINPVVESGLSKEHDIHDKAWLGLFAAGFHIGRQF